MAATVDGAKLEQFMGQMVGHMTGTALCFGIWVGDELGLYRAMAGAGPLTAEDIAAKAGCHPRLVREWLDGQAAGGLIEYDSESRPLRVVARGRGGARRPGLARLRRPGDELVRRDVHGHRQGHRRVPWRRRH